MKKVYLLFFVLFMAALPCNDAVGQYLYYHGSYDHGYYGNDSKSRFSQGYEYNQGNLSSRHHSRFGNFNSNQPSQSGSYYGNPNSDCYRGSYYSRRHIREEHYYGYPGYPNAPAPRHQFKPYYNTK